MSNCSVIVHRPLNFLWQGTANFFSKAYAMSLLPDNPIDIVTPLIYVTKFWKAYHLHASK